MCSLHSLQPWPGHILGFMELTQEPLPGRCTNCKSQTVLRCSRVMFLGGGFQVKEEEGQYFSGKSMAPLIIKTATVCAFAMCWTLCSQFHRDYLICSRAPWYGSHPGPAHTPGEGLHLPRLLFLNLERATVHNRGVLAVFAS